MCSHFDLESAIMDVEGAAAVLQVLEDQLTRSTSAGWELLRLKPREDLCVTVLSSTEQRALTYASQSLQQAVAEASRLFYAAIEGGRL